MNFLQAYTEAFKGCYPDKDVEVKVKRMRGEIRYAVVIDNHAGDILLSADDVKDATRAFNKGKK